MGEETGLTTFEEARDIVAAQRSGLYDTEDEFTVETYGYDAGDRWIVVCSSNRINDAPMTTVNKTTGEYEETYGIPGIHYECPDDAPIVGTPPAP